jgi:hypothetical protein
MAIIGVGVGTFWVLGGSYWFLLGYFLQAPAGAGRPGLLNFH